LKENEKENRKKETEKEKKKDEGMMRPNPSGATKSAKRKFVTKIKCLIFYFRYYGKIYIVNIILTDCFSKKEKESFTKSLTLAFENTVKVSFSRKVNSLNSQRPQQFSFRRRPKRRSPSPSKLRKLEKVRKNLEQPILTVNG